MVTVDMARISYPYMQLSQSETQEKRPEKRSRPNLWIIIVCCFFILIIVVSAQGLSSIGFPIRETVAILSLFLCSLSIFLLLYMFFCCYTEKKHLSTRYSNSLKEMFKFLYKEHKQETFLICFGFILILTTCAWAYEALVTVLQYLSSLAAIAFICFVFYLCKVPNAIELDILSGNAPCCGSEFAIQYHIGYLKLMLHNDTNDKEFPLHRRIENFEEENEITIRVKKLFIVLPVSCHVNTDLSVSRDDGITKLEKINQLRPKELGRGTPGRKYDNTLYELLNPGYPSVYLVAEIATPLVTLYDMSESSECTFLDRKGRREQYYLFCTKLEELLKNDRRCADSYVLVYYDDCGKPYKLRFSL